MPIIPTLYLSVKYILSQNPSVITWIYGSATCSGISGICFGKYMSVMKLFLKFELKYCNLSSFSYYLCIMILEFVYILWFMDILCGLINQDRWLCRNWQVPLIYQDYLQLKFLALVNEIYKTYQEARDGYDSSVMLISETAVIIISAHCIFSCWKKNITLIIVTWFQVCKWKSTMLSHRFRHCYRWMNSQDFTQEATQSAHEHCSLVGVVWPARFLV